MQGVAVTQAGDLGRTGLAQRCQQGASVGVQRPQHYIAPPALDAQAAERIATLRRAALLSTSKQSNSIRLAPAMRQIDRPPAPACGTPDFLPVDSQPRSRAISRAHGRLACATLARNGMFIIDNPLFPPIATAAVGGDRRNGCPASVQRQRLAGESPASGACSPGAVRRAGSRRSAHPRRGAAPRSVRRGTRPWTGARATAGTGADTRYRPTRPHPRPAAPRSRPPCPGISCSRVGRRCRRSRDSR